MDIWIKGTEISIGGVQYKIPEGQWVHVVAVDGKLFIDGAEVV